MCNIAIYKKRKDNYKKNEYILLAYRSRGDGKGKGLRGGYLRTCCSRKQVLESHPARGDVTVHGVYDCTAGDRDADDDR